MSNIPRRKIYEELLIFEEGILEIDRLIFSKENTLKYKDELPNYADKIRNSYKNIKSLLVMLFENKLFEKEEDFENELLYYVNNQKEVNQIFKKNKNLQKSFYDNCLILDENVEKIELKNIREFLNNLDKFNSEIPRILEIKREDMK